MRRGGEEDHFEEEDVQEAAKDWEGLYNALQGNLIQSKDVAPKLASKEEELTDVSSCDAQHWRSDDLEADIVSTECRPEWRNILALCTVNILGRSGRDAVSALQQNDRFINGNRGCHFNF